MGCGLEGQTGQLSPPSSSRWGPLDYGALMGVEQGGPLQA